MISMANPIIIMLRRGIKLLYRGVRPTFLHIKPIKKIRKISEPYLYWFRIIELLKSAWVPPPSPPV
jgi:hypothetical protein